MRILIFFFLLLSTGLLAQAADLKKWTNQNGETLVASIVGVLEEHVFFQTRTGKRFKYPIAALTPSDQTVVRSWEPTIKEKPNASGGITRANSPVAQMLEGKLVRPADRKGAFIDAPLSDTATPKYYAFYYSAHWCPPCRQFTPKLVQFYNQMKRSGADFEIIFISADRSKRQMYQYMKGDGMAWRAVDFEKGKGSYDIMKYSGSGIPCLVFIDHKGKVLSDSYRNGNYVGPYRVLEEMEKVLKRDLSRSI